MSYLVAAKKNEPGCIVVEVKRSKAKGLVSYLGFVSSTKGIRLLLIGDPADNPEFAPYQFAASVDDFIAKVMEM